MPEINPDPQTCSHLPSSSLSCSIFWVYFRFLEKKKEKKSIKRKLGRGPTSHTVLSRKRRGVVCTLVGVTKIHVSECDKNSVFYFLFWRTRAIWPFQRGCSCWLFIKKNELQNRDRNFSKFCYSTLFFQPRSDTFVIWMRWRKLKSCD
jgi:hypothetical protein